MRQSIYSVYDSKIDAYGTPFFSPNHSVALRSFLQAKLDPNTSIHHFPDDFRLYCLGEFDDASGLVSAQIPPTFIPENSTE